MNYSILRNPYNKGANLSWIVVNRGVIISGHESIKEAREAAARYADIALAFNGPSMEVSK